MNSQHVSGIIQLSNILPNEILRMINEYLYNPYEDTMNKVFEDIRKIRDCVDLKERVISDCFIYVNFTIKQLNELKNDKYYTSGYYHNYQNFPSKMYYCTEEQEIKSTYILQLMLKYNNIYIKSKNKKKLIQLLLKL